MENTINKNAIEAFVEDNSMEWEVVAPGMRRKIMAYDDSMMLVKVDFEKGAVGTLHHHYHTQISYVVKGKFEVQIDGKKQLLQAGDVFMVEPNLVHGAVCMEDGMLIDMFSPKREDFLPAD